MTNPSISELLYWTVFRNDSKEFELVIKMIGSLKRLLSDVFYPFWKNRYLWLKLHILLDIFDKLFMSKSFESSCCCLISTTQEQIPKFWFHMEQRRKPTSHFEHHWWKSARNNPDGVWTISREGNLQIWDRMVHQFLHNAVPHTVK